MYQRVTAVLVVRSGAEYLERTLAALAAQSRQPDRFIAVDAESSDGSRAALAAAHPHQFISVSARTSFGEAAAEALAVAPVSDTDNDWVWLLAHDNAPQPEALAQLLGAVEIAPSVAVAGPKLMQWHQPDVIAEFGESMTRFGSSVSLVVSELDQAQHDVQADVLAVAAAGMLVRRSLWTTLGGFDPALASVDAALDFCVRARLAGFRVTVVPGAKVASAGGPQHFGKPSVSEAARARTARAAQLHRRLVYAPLAAVPVHWLSLLPLALLRSLIHLVSKRPASVAGELLAAGAAAIGVRSVARARRGIRHSRRVSWKAIAPLRIPVRRAREARRVALERREQVGPSDAAIEPIGFVSGGALWLTAAVAILSVIAFGGLASTGTLTGGGVVPLARDVQALWTNVGYGWRDIGVGFVGASDPFATVLAVLGSLTFWNPPLSIPLLLIAAMPLSAITAWSLARRLTDRSWLPTVGALVWALAPPLLGSLSTGHLGAVIAHILLPWLVLLTLRARASWAASAGAALIFAIVAASAPSVVPALLVMWVARLALRPTAMHRIIGAPLPAAVLFAPLIVEQVARGNPLGLLADPGVPAGGATSSGLQLALGSVSGGSNGWTDLLVSLGSTASAAPFLVAALLLPLAALAVYSLWAPKPFRAMVVLVIALLGFATAVAASRIAVSSSGPDPVGLWPGSGLSLFWLGIAGAALMALDSLRSAAAGPALLLSVASTIVAVPLVASVLLGTASIEPGNGRELPAFVDAEAVSNPRVGTLVITPVGPDEIAVTLERGRGTTLDDESTLHATATTMSEAEARLAVLAGNLASRSGFDSAAELDALAIGFVVVGEGEGADTTDVVERVRDSLDGNPALAPVGSTSSGLLWRYDGAEEAVAEPGPAPVETTWGIVVLVAQGIVFGMTLLLAVPTASRRRLYTSRTAEDGAPATTFDEDTE